MIWWRWIAKKLCLLEYVLAVTSGCNINMFLSVFWAQKNFYYPFTEQLLFRNRKSVYCRETTINVHVILNGDFRVWLYTFSYGIVKIFGFLNVLWLLLFVWHGMTEYDTMLSTVEYRQWILGTAVTCLQFFVPWIEAVVACSQWSCQWHGDSSGTTHARTTQLASLTPGHTRWLGTF